MALNLNPDDYGIVGSLDKQGMEDRLKEIREQIASFGPTPVASIQRSADPVYGAGVPDVEYVTKGLRKYQAKSQGMPKFVKNYIADSKKFTDAYAEKLAYVPEARPEPTPEPEPKEKKERLRLPDLSETEKGEKIKAPKRFLEGKTTKIKSDFKKNPSFDGRSFQKFLKGATEMVPGGRPGLYGPGEGPSSNIPLNLELNTLYNKLKDEGMSADDMFKAAQYAGLTNVRTGKEGKSDYKQMIEMFENNFLVPKTTKETTKETVDVGMDLAEDAFGKKFKMKDYKAALDYEGQDKKYIKKYLKDYIKRGGNVSDKVLALFPKAFPM